MKIRFEPKLLALVLCFGFISCSLFSKESAPYAVSGDFVMEDNSTDYDLCGINLNVFNKAEKNIKEFTVVFFLFDKDGEPASECRSMLSFSVEKKIEAGKSFVCCISLDQYMSTIPEEPLTVDYLYVSSITFEDDSTWADPYGLLIF
jgi:hypothetical protein